jgi:hypothetical protein
MTTGAPEEIAIIGVGVQLPGVRTPAQLWDALCRPSGGVGGDVEPEQPTDEILVRDVVGYALADASLPPSALAGTATGIYLCTTRSGGGTRHTEEVARCLGTAGPTVTAYGPTALPLLHHALLTLRTAATDRALVIALDADGRAPTRAVALVLARASLAALHRSYAFLAGWRTSHPGGVSFWDADVIDQALLTAGQVRPAQVGYVHTPRFVPAVRSTLDQLLGQQATLGVLPGVLAGPGCTTGLVSLVAAALAVHHNHRPHVEPAPWPPREPQRVACTHERTTESVSHTIVTSAPDLPVPAHQDPQVLPQMCPISAPSHRALASLASAWAQDAATARSVAVLADTALDYRDHHQVRAAVVTNNVGGAIQGLRSIEDGVPDSTVLGPRSIPAVLPELVYVLPGLGTGHPRLENRGLAELSEYSVGVCAAQRALRHHTGTEVWGPGRPITCRRDRLQAAFICQIALAHALAARGITPDTVVGYGTAEPTAAVLAGALDLDEAARLIEAFAQQSTVNEQVRLGAAAHARLVLATPSACQTQMGQSGTDLLCEALRKATDRPTPSLLIEIGPYPQYTRAILDTVQSRHHVTHLDEDPRQLAHVLGELYLAGHTPRSTGQANARLVLPPPVTTPTADRAPHGLSPGADSSHVEAFVCAAVSRLADIDGRIPGECRWSDLRLPETDLVRLVVFLRQQSPAWSHLTTNSIDPDLPMADIAKLLAHLLHGERE